MSTALEELAELIAAESGMDLSGTRRDALQSALEKVAPGRKPAAVLREASEPQRGAELRTRLSEAIAVHETFFFRHRESLDAIGWHGLLATAHAAGGDRIRVWVAGCSTGEEPYTLAILASEAFGRHDPPLSILATDLSNAVLRRAEEAVYGRRSMRNVDEELRARYFTVEGRDHRVGEQLRRHVDFQQHNLVSDPPPQGAFELILCRNVLIYFDPPTVARAIGSLEQALAAGGTLLLGAADRLCGSTGMAAIGRKRGPRPARMRPSPPTQRPTGPATRRPKPVSWRDAPAGDRAPAHHVPAAKTREAPGDGERKTDDAPELDAAVAAADAGRLDEAVETTRRMLDTDPLDADVNFVCGIAELGRGDAPAAVELLRRTLYIDPTFALAAFELGRAYDALGDQTAAVRAYQQALQTLAPGHPSQERLASELDLADVAAACSARLTSLRNTG